MAMLKKTSPIKAPEDFKVNKRGYVYLEWHSTDGKRRRINYGTMVDSENRLMMPNQAFLRDYAGYYAEHSAQGDVENTVSIGLYAACLSVAKRTALYEALQQTVGPDYTNAILDLAMFFIKSPDRAMSHYGDEMRHVMCFADKVHSDAWYSNLFRKEINIADIRQFRSHWLRLYAKSLGPDGIPEVWLAVDNASGYIKAVDAKTGMPMTWLDDPDLMGDALAIHRVLSPLGSADIKVAGVILEQAFCQPEIIRYLQAMELDFLLRLTDDVAGYQTVFARQADEIRWNPRYLINAQAGLFGTTDKASIFGQEDEHTEKEYTISLFFDAKNGPRCLPTYLAYLAEVEATVKELQAKVDAGKPLEVPEEFSQMIIVKVTKDRIQLEVDGEEWKRQLDAQNFYGIASSQPFSASVIDQYYRWRQLSNIDDGSKVSLQDSDKGRMPSTPVFVGKLMTCFVADVIRHQVQQAAVAHGVPFPLFLKALVDCQATRQVDGHYVFHNNLSVEHQQILLDLGVKPEHLTALTQEYNQRLGKPHNNPVRQLPVLAGEAPPKVEAKVVEKRPIGRPKGSKNKKTLERERLAALLPPPIKRQPGRPKGSKNKTTLAREYMEQQAAAAAMTHGRGRPKGSKNKATLLREGIILPEKPVRGPGRPKGSKNKATLEREALFALKNRGPGRPRKKPQ